MEAKVITFFSTKGGVGKTLISLNIAVQLALENKKIFLLDLDLGAPQATSKLLGTDAKYCLFNLIPHLAEFKENKRDISNYLLRYKYNLLFLPSIFKMSQRNSITPQIIKEFITLIKREVDYVIIDAGSSLTDNLVAILESSNLIFLILLPDILSVYQTQWLLDTLCSMGFPLNMVKVILNRAESLGAINYQEIKAVIPTEMSALIPSEGKVVSWAVNKGVPVVIDASSSRIAQAIRKLAREIMERKDLFVEHTSLEKIKVNSEELGGEEMFWQKLGILEKIEISPLKEEEDQIIKFKKRVHERLLEELDVKRS